MMKPLPKSKKCSRCGLTKITSAFSKGANKGLASYCKKCMTLFRKKYKHTDNYRLNRRKYHRTKKGRYVIYKHMAKFKKRKFALTKEQFLSFWNHKCHYCGKQVDGVGLDRVNNKLDYTMDNVVSCCTTCNIMKNVYTTKEFLEHITAIYKHSVEKGRQNLLC